jgi:hypothetical protein
VLVCDLSSPKIYSALIGVSKLVWYFFTTSVCGLKVRGRSLQNWFGPTDGGGSWRFPKIKGKIYLSSPPRQNAWRKDKSSVHWWFTAASQRHQQNIYKQYFFKKIWNSKYLTLFWVKLAHDKPVRVWTYKHTISEKKNTLGAQARHFMKKIHCSIQQTCLNTALQKCHKKRNQVIISRLVECATC